MDIRRDNALLAVAAIVPVILGFAVIRAGRIIGPARVIRAVGVIRAGRIISAARVTRVRTVTPLLPVLEVIAVIPVLPVAAVRAVILVVRGFVAVAGFLAVIRGRPVAAVTPLVWLPVAAGRVVLLVGWIRCAWLPAR